MAAFPKEKRWLTRNSTLQIHGRRMVKDLHLEGPARIGEVGQSTRTCRTADTARNLEVMRRMWNGVIAGAVMICRKSSSLPLAAGEGWIRTLGPP